MDKYEVVIGLEVHAQLSTKSKIFCSCSTNFGAEPNTHGCPVCLGMPGSLPVLNKKAVEYAIMASIATNCKINEKSIFARKNYFYPDLPKGYQISQYEQPLSQNGFLTIADTGRKIEINRIHMEEDAGKLIHENVSLFDVNRCGTPLIEIVTEPVIQSPREAFLYLNELKHILEYLDICDCNMEEGSLRCDANISLRPAGQKELGTKTELKNMNSFHGVEKALEYEIKRQTKALDNGESIVQQTLLWDTKNNMALPMRTKEEAHDYRYFPEPDLMPLVVSKEWINQIKEKLPELPTKRQKRFMEQYSLNEYDSMVLTSSKEIADYFENTAKKVNNYKLISNWIQTEILRLCKEKKCNINELTTTNENFISILNLLIKETINQTTAKEVISEVEETGNAPEDIIKSKGLAQISGEDAISDIIDNIIKDNPNEVKSYKDGKHKLIGFFVGEVMKKTKGKANPKTANKILTKKLQ